MTRSIRLASISVLVTGALAVSACGGGDTIEAENESVEAVAEKVAKADVRPNPGRWESKMKIVKMELPGLPAEAQGMMKSQLAPIPFLVNRRQINKKVINPFTYEVFRNFNI